MKNKIVKLAMIRENDESPCPYGLTIPDACISAGRLVNNMTSLESDDPKKIEKEDVDKIKQSNNRVLMLSKDKPARCRYLNSMFDKNEFEEDTEAKVECSFGDTAAAGVGNANLSATTPLAQYLGVGYFSSPLGFYNQDLTYSNGFQAYVNRYFASLKDDDKIKKQ
ncbi:MAG: hypothetical protein ACOYMA_00290 [Bacteroidia bacterium]